MSNPLLDRITFDPQVMGGKPCLRGMRVSVGTIVGLIASGATPEEILVDYPYLEREDITAALSYAACRVPKAQGETIPSDLSDTSDEALAVQLECLRQMTPQERLRRACAWSVQVRRMAFNAFAGATRIIPKTMSD